MNFQMFNWDLEKAEEPEIKLPTSDGSSKKQESSRKTSTSTLLTMSETLIVWITANSGKFKRLEYQTTWPAFWEICMQVKKQELKPVMEQRTGSKLGKEYVKTVYWSPCLFNFYAEYIMWNAGLDESQAGIKIAGRSINNLTYADDNPLVAEKWRVYWWKWKRRVKKLV